MPGPGTYNISDKFFSRNKLSPSFSIPNTRKKSCLLDRCDKNIPGPNKYQSVDFENFG